MAFSILFGEGDEIRKRGLTPLLDAPGELSVYHKKGRVLRGGFAPSSLHSPLQPIKTLAFSDNRAGEGSGVRQI
jgi:hypothetical protein